MVNEYGAQYWCYSFLNDLPDDIEYGELYRLLPEIYIYAFSEEEARKKFKKLFNMQAGELIRREPW